MAEVNESMRRLGLGGGGKKNKQHINTLDMDRGKLCHIYQSVILNTVNCNCIKSFRSGK